MVLGLKDNFEFEGYEVLTASDGAAGLERARTAEARPRDPRHHAARSCRASRSARPCAARASRRRSSCSPRAARRSTRWWAWSWARTTTSPSPSRSASCWRACAPSCAAREGSKKRLSRYRFSDVELDFEVYRAKKGGEPLDLSPREFELLRYLIERKGETVSRDQLLEDVWGYESYPSTRTVDTHIAKLRAKIGDSGSRAALHPDHPRHRATSSSTRR